MNLKILLIIVVLLALAGCAFSDSFMRAQHMPVVTSKMSNAPMIFGGAKRDIYLGNISSDQSDEDSIYNKKGKYGDPNSELSISNRKSEYGSVTSVLSACNPNATNPPILVDRYNMIFGNFTLNTTLENKLPATFIDSLRKICKS